jgi:hypothetical protein
MTIMTKPFEMTTPIFDASAIDEALPSFEPVYLDPTQVKFRHAGENLTLTLADGTFYPRVTLRRCFPFSTRGMYVSVRTPDTEKDRGQEVGIFSGIERLDPDSYEALSAELKLHYFVPVIKKIYKVKEEYGFIYWNVLTDRGEKEIIMRDNVIATTRQISANRWLMIDLNQARYEINDDGSMDSRSRKLMIRHLLL